MEALTYFILSLLSLASNRDFKEGRDVTAGWRAEEEAPVTPWAESWDEETRKPRWRDDPYDKPAERDPPPTEWNSWTDESATAEPYEVTDDVGHDLTNPCPDSDACLRYCKSQGWRGGYCAGFRSPKCLCRR
ncbi:hypothetical protein CDAR_438151 [Caerostris darwini]|uniref:Invertebrate defensins family profile domain-containing protein n=1 Tax=Caerostris darwini TaxID=1538125 RepID=A0AAV4X4J3_9ARAC|nr:hypothetical protein CDAR_438151 [Caerostris darwini]